MAICGILYRRSSTRHQALGIASQAGALREGLGTRYCFASRSASRRLGQNALRYFVNIFRFTEGELKVVAKEQYFRTANLRLQESTLAFTSKCHGTFLQPIQNQLHENHRVLRIIPSEEQTGSTPGSRL
jgi:hypothetical protein